MKMMAFDAQTSGGLLMCVPPAKSDEVLSDLFAAGLNSSSIIGTVLPKGEKYIILS